MHAIPSLRLVAPALILGTALTLQAQAPETKSKTKPPHLVIRPDINGLRTIIAPPATTKRLKVAIFHGRRIKSIPQATVTRVLAARAARRRRPSVKQVVWMHFDRLRRAACL